MRELIEKHLKTAKKKGTPNKVVAAALEKEILAYFVTTMRKAGQANPDLAGHLSVSEAVVGGLMMEGWEA